jgi:hypothetical protein
MSDTNCNKCGGRIFWHKSKTGKPYPCDSQDRRDFHKCQAKAPEPAPSPAPSWSPPATVPTKDLSSRVADLEAAVVSMLARIHAVENGKARGAVPY